MRLGTFSARFFLCPTLCFVVAGTYSLHADSSSIPLRLVNVASEAGITMEMLHGGHAKDWIAEANGSGAAVLDYDNDGWMDVLIVNGATMERLREIVAQKIPAAPEGGVRLFRNRKNGKFVDVTKEAGLSSPYWGTGANAADYDNDGDVDILITTIGLDLLYRNNSDGTFSEIGAKAGLNQVPAWHTGSTLGDYDADGDLDLFIVGYLDLEAVPVKGDAPVCNYRGVDGFCGPLGLKPGADVLYRNNGDGTFADVTAGAGIRTTTNGHGFTAVFEDFDQDGKLDLFVANDSGRNFLYLNQGGTFREDALASGVAYNAHGKQQADMGVALGDYDSDGDLDLLTTTFSEDYFPLFEQQAPGLFEDVSYGVGLRNATMPLLGWGCGFSDLDNDGDRDLWISNGHVYPMVGKLSTTTYMQPISLFQNEGGKFKVIQGALEGVSENSYRGGVSGDFNNDGHVDLLITPIKGSPVLLENRTMTNYSWIGFRLEGVESNSEAIGARVEIEYCGKKQFDTVRNGGSYASRNDPRVHFGLGECHKVDRAKILWPGSRAQTLNNLKVNQWVTAKDSQQGIDHSSPL